MARLSLGSQHFSAKDRRLSTMDHVSTPPPNPEIPMKNAELDNFKVQNKLLAMKNSELTLKVADLEAKIAQLVAENVSLQSNTLSETDTKFRILNVLDMVESSVADKFSGILQEIREIRAQEQLPQSHVVSALESALVSCRPVTSTPQADREIGTSEQLPTWGGLPLGSEDVTKERSVSVASLADLAMLDDLKSESPEVREQNNVGKSLLPELSTRVSVLPDDTLTLASKPLEAIDEEEKSETQAKKPVGCQSTMKAKIKPEVKAEAKRPRRRRPLANVTNKRRATLPRRAKILSVEPEEQPSDGIFEFVDDDSLTNPGISGRKRRGEYSYEV